MRLDKFLANSGIGSRSEVKRIIKDKRIRVNGEIIKRDSFNVDETKDVVLFNETEIKYKKFYYILLNKPQGYVSASIDNVYPPVTDLLPEYRFANLHTVGRLDYDTSGIILLTNDGDLTYKLTHPKYHVDKTYLVKIKGHLTKEDKRQLESGVVIDNEYKTAPAKITVLKISKVSTSVEITIHEGKNRQIRKMFSKFGYEVIELKRIKIGNISIGNLKEGKFRNLSKKEILNILKS